MQPPFRTAIRAEEFLDYPESAQPLELLDGEVIMSPAPLLHHQRLVFQTARMIASLMPDGEVLIAPVDVQLDERNVVQADVLWVSSANPGCVAVEGRYLRGAPDLVVEVHSPSTEKRDRDEKFRLYDRSGVREYWMLDPDLSLIEVWGRTSPEAEFRRIGVFGPGETFVSPVLGNQTVVVDALVGTFGS